jgi:hypothetical protein
MRWRITIHFPSDNPGQRTERVHRVRNFSEALYSEFRDSPLGDVSPDEGDHAIDTLFVHHVHKRDLRRTLKRLTELAAAHFPDMTAVISAEKDGQ